MNRLTRLAALARAAGSAASASGTGAAVPQTFAWGALKSWSTSLTASYATGAVTEVDAEHATGLERQELDSLAKGVDPWHEAWLDAPFGTEDNPVTVTSMFAERIVGVPDPDDDSLVWWGTIEEGQPAKQIVEGGEYFVLKRVPDESGGHHH